MFCVLLCILKKIMSQIMGISQSTQIINKEEHHDYPSYVIQATFKKKVENNDLILCTEEKKITPLND